MRLTILLNPRSGRGKARGVAEAIRGIARGRGHRTRSVVIDADRALDEAALTDCDRLVIVGGDGTVHHLLPLLCRTRTPFYHCGTGTANLIARALGMSSRPGRVVEQLECDCTPTRLDLPACNDHPFLIMVSVGVDASVIHRLEHARSTGGYRAYIRPVIAEVFEPRIAHTRVKVDGRSLKVRPGVIVVSNLPGYGGGFDPCRQARPDDGVLDLACIPGGTSLSLGLRYLGLRARLPLVHAVRGREIEIEAVRACRLQIDGERPDEPLAVLRAGEKAVLRMTDRSVYAHAPRHHP